MARRENRNDITVQRARVEGYHAGGNSWNERYAFDGFAEGNYYLASDRKIPLDENFHRMDAKPMKGYGIETEMEAWGLKTDTALAAVLQSMVWPHFPSGLFKLQRDGSLDGGECSAEMISQPMSKEAMRNLYPAYKEMYNGIFPIFSISAARSGNCGMHVNISTGCFGTTEAAQDTAVRKLYYIINRHFKLFCNLFNRDENRTGYCDQMDYEQAQTMNLHGFHSNHYCCFNLGHYDAGRVEIRLVGGQKNYAAFRNTMETIFHLVERVKTISWSACDNVESIFAGCNQYVADRLQSNAADRGLITADTMVKIVANSKHEDGVL